MGDFLGGIFDLFAAGADWAHSMSSVLFYVFSVLQAVASFLYRVLTNVFLFLFRAAARLAQFLRHAAFWLYNNILKRIYDALKAAQEWIEKRLKPIIDFLTKLRARFDKIFRTYIKPTLDLIQHIRQTLLVLRLLHVKWAAELDAKLAQIQAAIARPFLEIRAVLNQLIDLATILSDPAQLLRRPMLIISLRRAIPALIRAVTGFPPGYFFPSPRGKASKHFAPVPFNFNPRDPAVNPPASFYLRDEDGIGALGGSNFIYTGGDAPVDDLELLDFWNIGIYDVSPCTNPAECLEQARRLLLSDLANA